MWPATSSPSFKLRQEAPWRRTAAEAHQVCVVQATIALLCREALVPDSPSAVTQLMSAQPTAVKMYVGKYTQQSQHIHALPLVLYCQVAIQTTYCCGHSLTCQRSTAFVMFAVSLLVFTKPQL